ncbi:monovalent cation:proton antiporter-2 (CPA2) family protein [Mesorhizobium sp. J428]|uniref:monovalent cation:proton antiporter-2 (CPA2) family protein n=1 Tax=Mesorhizobium sp. J428 TaxID=2898440 RepID=UPI002150D209|nr:monovalent cation:proton antiporter-2 (CPA2) family protein [Mesorhizobium sp. J428]MCR5858536.1 monovalent cation:proton antiporter-2 (CPA2) family protein [Mesorhizobium sp. J428]
MQQHGPVIYAQVLLMLGGAVIAAPLFKRFGLETVLGYIAAGIAIGPVTLLITGSDQLLQLGELGVVFLLFIIGLELKPARLWAMRKDIFGLGIAQVVSTGIVLTALAVVLAGFSLPAAILAGFGLALSSTAFATQILEQQGALNRRYGQISFSILLLQDMAIVPLLAVIPILAPFAVETEETGYRELAVAVAAVATLFVSGRYLLNPLFRIIANTGAREAMIAAALLVVLGAATLMQLAGLSMAMGAFLAGVMLADSSYRHELEACIEPFRGILLGLFFMAVGMSLDLAVIRDHWVAILVAVPIMMLVKAVLIYPLVRLFGASHDDALQVALILPQGGEFGFVLFSAATGAAILSEETASLLIAIVTISMALTPIVVRLGQRLKAPLDADEIEENFDEAGADVLMIGFSRFGQIASQILLSGGTSVTIIDNSANRVRAVEKFGFRIYFGDGTRKDVLEAAGIRDAKIVAVCTRERETTDKIVDLIQHDYPDVKLYVRAYDRTHTLQLRAKGVEYEIRETFESGLMFGRRTLEGLGVSEMEALEIAEDVRRRDEERLAMQASGGTYAGNSTLTTSPVSPEPLTRPSREARRLDKAIEEADKKEPSAAPG